jgi:hypothetical protein
LTLGTPLVSSVNNHVTLEEREYGLRERK